MEESEGTKAFGAALVGREEEGERGE